MESAIMLFLGGIAVFAFGVEILDRRSQRRKMVHRASVRAVACPNPGDPWRS